MSPRRAWEPGALALRALAIARSQLGVLEDPLGSNCGPQVDQYLKSVNLNPGYEWCQAFVYWCFREAARQLGVGMPLPKTARVIEHWEKANSLPQNIVTCYTRKQVQANESLVKRGMLVVIDRGGRKGHTGFIDHYMRLKKPERRTLFTIEGNINPDADPNWEGWGVFPYDRRSIDDGNLIGVIGYATPPGPGGRASRPRRNPRRPRKSA